MTIEDIMTLLFDETERQKLSAEKLRSLEEKFIAMILDDEDRLIM